MSKKLHLVLHLAIIITLAAGLALSFQPGRTVHAASYVVNTLVDENDFSCVDGDCSLRDAIMLANASVGVPDDISFTVTGTINLTLGPLNIMDTLTITGPGARSLAINGGTLITAMIGVLAPVSVTISGLTLQNASVAQPLALGGAVLVNTGATLTVQNCTFRNNVAGTAAGFLGQGGAIYNMGTLYVQNSTFDTNRAFAMPGLPGNGGQGGAIYSQSITGAQVVNSTFMGNTAGEGGAVYANIGLITLTNSTLAYNSATTGGNIFGGTGGANVMARNSIVLTMAGTNCNVALTSGGTNNIHYGDASCGAGFANVNPQLMGPGNYGGQTDVGAIPEGSPAIDGGNATVCMTVLPNGPGGFDQIGQPHDDGDGAGGVVCDIGSFEFQYVVPPVVVQPAAIAGPPLNFDPQPPAPLCSDFTGATNPVVRADIPGGTVTGGGVFCRVIAENGKFVKYTSAGEIGNNDILNQGIISAVDVFGLVGSFAEPDFNNTIKVCLQGSGAFYWLDATQAPRTVNLMNATYEGGYTCAVVPEAGTVVLVPGPTAPAPVAAPANSAAGVTSLSGCMVTTKDMLNLRDAPSTSAGVIKWVPYNVTLTAFARSGAWFNVDYLGVNGWLSGSYLTTSGACGN
ncbi:MAG: SH3 domain-containing protein [Anaerolineae bacterium]|nr:SH3 domain-containing protein [Anaerolineae bacterium]